MKTAVKLGAKEKSSTLLITTLLPLLLKCELLIADLGRFTNGTYPASRIMTVVTLVKR
jgi:hypothetical protein